jgi:hypothetical protein
MRKHEVVGTISVDQPDADGKRLVLQQLKYEDGDRELRFGYYRGNGSWGQDAPTMPLACLRQLLAEALVRGWL